MNLRYLNWIVTENGFDRRTSEEVVRRYFSLFGEPVETVLRLKQTGEEFTVHFGLASYTFRFKEQRDDAVR